MPFLLAFSSHFTSCLAIKTLNGWNGILLKEYLNLSEDEIADLEDKSYMYKYISSRPGLTWSADI